MPRLPSAERAGTAPPTAATTCRCTHGRARALVRSGSRVWVHPIRGSGVGVRVGRRGVGDGTRDTSRSGEREGQCEWGTASPRSSGPPSWGTLSSLHGRLARSLFFYSILSAGLSSVYVPHRLLRLRAILRFLRALRTRPYTLYDSKDITWFLRNAILLLERLWMRFTLYTIYADIVYSIN